MITVGCLKRVPMRLSATWIEKTVTTDPPRLIPHTEYALSFQVECEEPLLLVCMFSEGGRGIFSKDWRSKARSEYQLRLSFLPVDWRHSDAAQVNFDGMTFNVEHAAFKNDPRPFVSTDFLNDTTALSSGTIVTLASIRAGSPIECQLIAIAKTETDAKRGRWSVKPALAADLPANLHFLMNGKASGTF